MWMIGKLLCGLGALAITLLGLDMITGHAGFEFPGGLLRFVVLMPLAIVGSLTGFLMLRATSSDRPNRRRLLIGAGAPLLLILALAGLSQMQLSSSAHVAVVLCLVVAWAIYGATVLQSGRSLYRTRLGSGPALLLIGVGLALMVQAIGAAINAIAGPELQWPGAMAFAGVLAAAGLMAVLLTSIVLMKRRSRPI